MDAEAILARAREQEPPEGWVVFPLNRRKVLTGIFGWIFGAVLGLALFALMFPIVVPYNYIHGGVFGAIFSTLFLAMLLFIGLGSLWALYTDARRLRAADKHLIVITPEDFVKQEGDKINHVPLTHVRYVTARGRVKPDRNVNDDPDARLKSPGENMLSFLFGRGITQSNSQRRKSMRTPISLAFVDSRTDKEVLVVTDTAYGDPYLIAAHLKQYSAAVQQLV